MMLLKKNNRDSVLHLRKSYFIGILFLLFGGSCHATTVYLNHTAITLSNGISLSDGFSFSFRACSLGILLTQGTDDIVLSLVPGTSNTSHAKINLFWKFNNGTMNNSAEIAPLFAMDSNVKVTVQITANGTGSIFQLSSPDVKLNTEDTFISDLHLQNLAPKSQLILGSTEFSGCIFNGANVDVDSRKTDCPLESLKPCTELKCPAGYTGRYCQVNINECLSSTEQCHSFSTCIDLVNGFECKCGKYWQGRLCDDYIGSPCENVTCKNRGICRDTQDGNNFTCTCYTNFTGRYCETKSFSCMSSPCENGGTCSNTTTRDYTCSCVPGFLGKNCEKNIDDCAVGPCGPGQCIDGVQNYTCNCTDSGFTGDTCRKNINECNTSLPCMNGATCKDLWGTYSCSCKAGFTGENCEVDTDDCASNPCQNNGQCFDLINGYNCSCAAGFEGKNCSVNIQECERKKPCVNAISCEDGIDDYKCNCTAGYEGKDCHIDINECLQYPCKNGTCVNGPGNYSCNCTTGFTGFNCDTNINDCTTGLCQNGGTCRDGLNKYTCKCATGYNGTNCENNINDCASKPCLHHGACIDQVNDYNCSCIPSYTGRNCETYQDPCTPDPCDNDGLCMNDTLLGYKCNCSQEFGGQNCENKFGICFPNPCQHGKCNETVESYNCTCDKGYTGKNCSVDINECLSGPCQHGGKCRNTDGSFHCNCTGTGYHGDLCEHNVNECTVNPCVHGRCYDTNGSYDCGCDEGWEGKNCNQRDYPCSDFESENKEEYCLNGGQCKDMPGKNDPGNKKCTCVAGYTGIRCDTDINECNLGYCENNSTCKDLINDYNCTCKPGFTGRNCSTDINECDPDPCVNNSTCVDMINKFHCRCKLGFNGTYCEQDIDWCALYSPCQNGASCTDIVETYNCSCLPGFKGVNCSEDIKDCEPNPCVYDGPGDTKTESICIEKSNITAMIANNFTVNETHFYGRDGYICRCLPGLEGQNCSTDMKDCNDTLCMNNSTCIELVNDFECTCPSGYTGKRCDMNIDDCMSSPCQHNGTCIDLLNGYKCNCTSKYKGENCSEPKNFCTLCQNNARCDENLKCVCASGFTGDVCDMITTVNLNGNGYWKIESMNNTSGKINISVGVRTTLPDGLIMLVNLVSGNIKLHLKNSVVFFGASNVSQQPVDNDGWHAIDMLIDGSNLEIFIDHDRKKVVSLGGGTKVIKYIYIGGSPTESGPHFTGCIQDLTINNLIIPSKNGIKVNATAGICNKPDVCGGTPCNEHGKCIDEWNRKTCKCYRQYFGDSCKFEIMAFNFQELTSSNNTRQRRSTNSKYAISTVDFNLTATSSFSFSIRTRKSEAFIALLLSSTDTSSDYTYVLYQLKQGRLEITKGSKTKDISARHTSNQTLNDGQWHVISHSSVSIGSLPFSLGDVAVKQVYLGGLQDFSIFANILSTNISFDGCLQAVKTGDSFLTNQNIPGAATTNITLVGATPGCKGSDVCSFLPCKYDGNCTDLWNAFNCTCKQGFAGATCSQYGCIVRNNACPAATDCIDIPGKPGDIKCSSSLTYNGVNSSTSIDVVNTTSDKLSFAVRTSQLEGLILSTYITDSAYVAVGVKQGRLLLQGKTPNVSLILIGQTMNDGNWQNITIDRNSFGDANLNSSTGDSVANLLSLLTERTLTVGLHTNNTVKDIFSKALFGCFKNLVIGTHVYDLEVAPSSNVLSNCINTNSCAMYKPCKNGMCENLFNDYRCICSAFYTGVACNLTTDVNCAFPSPLCNNGNCVNLTEGVSNKFSDVGKDYFECDCHDGFNGSFCENETDECLSNPCRNNGNCTDLHLSYNCACVPGWTGKDCSSDINECEVNLCQHGGVCVDQVNAYTCSCTGTGFNGSNCQYDVDECAVANFCKHNSTCSNLAGSYECGCRAGYFGDKCEYNNTQYCKVKQPCVNGSCSSDMTGYNCTCVDGFSGKNCSLSPTESDDNNDLTIIIVVSVAVVLVILIVLAVLFIRFCRDKSGMEGTYSPNKEEQISGNVEMNTMKKPNTERLI